MSWNREPTIRRDNMFADARQKAEQGDFRGALTDINTIINSESTIDSETKKKIMSRGNNLIGMAKNGQMNSKLLQEYLEFISIYYR